MCLLDDSSPGKLTVWEGRSYVNTSDYDTGKEGHRQLWNSEGRVFVQDWAGPPGQGRVIFPARG